MCGAMGRQLVPITREVLAAFYNRYPLEPVPREEADALLIRLDAAARAVARKGTKTGELVFLATPTRIDGMQQSSRFALHRIGDPAWKPAS